MPTLTNGWIEANCKKDWLAEYVTDSTRGLRLRKTDTGITFNFRSTFRGKQRSMEIGRWPALDIHAARVKVNELRARLEHGENVFEAAKIERVQELARGKTVEQAIGEYIAYLKEEIVQEHIGLAPRNKTWADTDAILRRNVVPALGRKCLGDVTPRDLALLEDRIKNGEFSSRYDGKPLVSSVRQTRKNLSAMFSWAAWPKQGYVTTNPCAVLQPLADAHGRETGRDRPMTEQEIFDFWRLLDGADLQRRTALLLKFALVTGRRSSEVRLLRVDELRDLDGDNAHMVIPADRIKNKKPLVMALSKMAVGIIREALTDEGQQFVFESDDNKGQPRGRQIMNDALNGKRGRGGPGILKLMGIDADDAFKPHDFRHTAGTFLVDVLGFMLSDVSLALGHTFKGERVAAVRQAPTVTRGYVHSHYLIQKRRIMEAWADELTRIIGGNVIRLAA